MIDDHDEDARDPFDDELEDALMLAAELIARVKRVGMTKLQLPIEDEHGTWIVNITKSGVFEKPNYSIPDHDGSHDGSSPKR
jgi:hypothetical protein